jgi:P27 family predicted phage terminase small subunit
MQPGTKPKPNEVKELEGNPGRRPMFPVIKPRSDKITCPIHLSGIARREWRRIAPELQRLGLLTNIDRAALASYCQEYSRWVVAEKDLKTEGLIFETDKGYQYQNPKLAVANKAMELMHKFLVEFGLTPSSRTRVSGSGISLSGEEDPFTSMLHLGEN